MIAITKVEKENPIPGVAIATALMPPLSTAGYGLALGILDFFLVRCICTLLIVFSFVLQAL